jgi:hypothetical protein
MSLIKGWALDAFGRWHRYVPKDGRWVQKCQRNASRPTPPTHARPDLSKGKGCDPCDGKGPVMSKLPKLGEKNP